MTSHLLVLLVSLIAVIVPLRYGCTDIIRGYVVCPHSWPFMAAVQADHLTVCGGAPVKKQWVLTAAHYKLNKPGGRVLGDHQASIAVKEQQIFKVMCYFPNPHFDWSSKENDIMLLKLNGMAKLNKYVQLLPLPVFCEDTKPGTTCRVAGWGVRASGKPSKHLWQTALKIVALHASFGKGCGRRGMPGVYIRLTEEYIAWKEEIISLHRDP
nr:PREDICTED: granzyme A-like [Phalacrocorax carbo]